MIQIKKTLLTLVALLITAVTGAWAQNVLNLVVDGTSATIKYDGNANNNPILGSTDWEQSGYGWDEEYTTRPTITTVTIDESCKNFSGTSLHGLLFWFSGLTTINGLENLNTANVQDMEYMFAGCSKLTSLDLSSFNTASVTTMFCMFEGCSKLTTVDLSSWNTENVEKINALFNECSELTTVDLSSWNTAKVWNTGYMFYNCSKLENIYVGDGWSTTKVTNSSSMFDGCTKLLSMNTANPAIDKTNAHTGDGGYLKVKPAASSGPEVAWDKAEKTGQFTMPGGNVTLEPEYYPQATAAEGAVTAATDAKATTDAPLVTIDETKLTGATKMMYYVSTDATAPAYDAEGWTDVLPTAEKFTEAANLNVWYYPVGTDEGVGEATATYSDGDMNANALTVTIAAAPLWNAEFDLTNAPEEDKAGKWSTDIPEGGVVKGTEVKVTYTGTKKVIGVKAEKKAAGVKVTAITLNKTATTITAGQTETLSVSSVTPDDATDQTVTWSSDNDAVATVDADGKVTAVALGTANITATANDGSGVTATCVVTVSKVVTINLSDWGERGQRSFTKDGVTVSAGMIDPVFGELGGDITISTTLGIFTKIVVTAEECYASGTGWSGDESTRTWAGTPASTVSFRGEFVGRDSNPTTIVCTIVPTN